jgi:hypothetical protein
MCVYVCVCLCVVTGELRVAGHLAGGKSTCLHVYMCASSALCFSLPLSRYTHIIYYIYVYKHLCIPVSVLCSSLSRQAPRFLCVCDSYMCSYTHIYAPLRICVCALYMCSALSYVIGTHHAFYDRGEGFCYFSDIAGTH